jgi:hypothetical protein
MNGNIEERFLAELRHHLAGWKTKVLEDFGEASFAAELASLAGDPVYSKFHLHSPEYVLIRLMGRMSISIGRRLGEIYDKLPRFVAQARYGLSKDQVAPKMGGKLELDVCIPLRVLTADDVAAVEAIASKYLDAHGLGAGLGIEIRYNFNPNDSARLRKDVEMAELLREQELLPVYLIFAENSPRDEAIARLKRAGWTFLVGRPALEFISELVGTDINGLLDQPLVAAEIKKEIDEMTAQMFDSFAFRSAMKRR